MTLNSKALYCWVVITETKVLRRRRLHPKWGYECARVPGVECLACGRKIGRRRFRHVTMLARFGQMLFEHVKCPGARKRGK